MQRTLSVYSLLFLITLGRKATRDAAAVRISMTVAQSGTADGLLLETTSESSLDTDDPSITLIRRAAGRRIRDLTIMGTNVASANELKANHGLSSRGVVLHGAGFIVSVAEAEQLGLGRRPNLERHIRPYRNGRDLVGRSRGVLALDLFGLSAAELRTRFPEVYQHVLERVKPERDHNLKSYRRENWWLFGENVPAARAAWLESSAVYCNG